MREPPTFEFKNRVDHLLSLFGESNDLYCRYFQLHEVKGCILYHSGITDMDKLQSDVLKPILAAPKIESLDEILPIVELTYTEDSETIVQGILQGKCAIILDRKSDILLADVGLNRARSIASPENEQTIRGSLEAFIEDIAVNSHLIHKRLKNPNLVERHYVLGKESLTKVSLLYIEGKADPAIVQQIAARLQSSKVEIVKSPGQISEILEENPWSLMPKVLQTERPDTTVTHLAEAKIVLLVDGCSYAVVLPATFFLFFQAADDFNLRWWNGTFFRILRYFGALLTLGLPSVYISIVSNHFEVLPIDLVFSLKASLENVPLNPVIEAFFMIIVLELLKEAAIRLPKSISPALSTVGGLVIGTEVVRANLVSTTMIVVISLTAVASFAVPNYEMRLALRLISIPIMFASAFMGFAGISFSFSLLVMYLCSLETYGVPYFYPLSPLNPKRLVMAIIQLPRKLIRSRK